ncbi:MAG: hypothetical protein HXX10_07500 [Rhodoplanes sp.]|uniref:hypothetical protein n=1 Tax=Rhodoplanes sp. TaxID=1968906 RepID=UPI0018196B6F|nr:hypothetical protein [Rhodoplanes sp.]NVO13865.1 hypothetical protein [Rhodoplanes sp.]
MSVAEIVRLPAAKPPRHAKRKRLSAAERARRWQSASAAAVLGVALMLIVLSLSHLAAGFALVTGSPVGGWEAWAWAASIDLGFVACEAAQLCATTKKAEVTVAKYAKWTVIGLLIVSAVMNAFALTANAGGGWQMYAAAVLGFVIPAAIYSTAQIGLTMWTRR